MIEARVVGFRHSTGVYQDIPYDNYMVHVVFPSDDPDHQGEKVMEVKIRSKLNYVPRIGDYIRLVYGPSGLSRVEVV